MSMRIYYRTSPDRPWVYDEGGCFGFLYYKRPARNEAYWDIKALHSDYVVKKALKSIPELVDWFLSKSPFRNVFLQNSAKELLENGLKLDINTEVKGRAVMHGLITVRWLLSREVDYLTDVVHPLFTRGLIPKELVLFLLNNPDSLSTGDSNPFTINPSSEGLQRVLSNTPIEEFYVESSDFPFNGAEEIPSGVLHTYCPDEDGFWEQKANSNLIAISKLATSIEEVRKKGKFSSIIVKGGVKGNLQIGGIEVTPAFLYHASYLSLTFRGIEIKRTVLLAEAQAILNGTSPIIGEGYKNKMQESTNTYIPEVQAETQQAETLEYVLGA